MKKIFYAVAIIVLMANVSCKKSTDGNKNVLVENGNNSASENTSTTTERYVADDGSAALVTIVESEKENSISVKSNNKIISASREEKTADGGIYKNFDFEIVAKKDTVTIKQGNNLIVLKKVGGL